MTPTRLNDPCPWDCTSLSLFCFPFYCLSTLYSLYKDFNYFFLGLYLPLHNFVSHTQGLMFNCCFLWTVPLFLKISKEWSIRLLFNQLFIGLLLRLLPLHALLFVLSVHWTIPPMLGFHHMYFASSLTVHWTIHLIVHWTVPPMLSSIK